MKSRFIDSKVGGKARLLALLVVFFMLFGDASYATGAMGLTGNSGKGGAWDKAFKANKKIENTESEGSEEEQSYPGLFELSSNRPELFIDRDKIQFKAAGDKIKVMAICSADANSPQAFALSLKGNDYINWTTSNNNLYISKPTVDIKYGTFNNNPKATKLLYISTVEMSAKNGAADFQAEYSAVTTEDNILSVKGTAYNSINAIKAKAAAQQVKRAAKNNRHAVSKAKRSSNINARMIDPNKVTDPELKKLIENLKAKHANGAAQKGEGTDANTILAQIKKAPSPEVAKFLIEMYQEAGHGTFTWEQLSAMGLNVEMLKALGLMLLDKNTTDENNKENRDNSEGKTLTDADGKPFNLNEPSGENSSEDKNGKEENKNTENQSTENDASNVSGNQDKTSEGTGATNENQTKGTSTEKVSGNMNMQAAETAAESKSEINSSAVDAQSSANSQVQVASNAQTVNAVQVKSENNGVNSG